MRDQISVTRLMLLHPAVREDFKDFIEAAEAGLGITLRIVQGLRTFDEQQAIYDQGRTKPGKIVSNAKPGSSFHNYGLAVDLGKVLPGAIDWNFDYKKLIPYMPAGMKWGGSFRTFKDRPHFEMPCGKTWRELLERYQAGRFIADTRYVQL